MKRKKNSKFISRFLSLLLTLVMVVTMLPAVAKADTANGSGSAGTSTETTDNSGLVLNKTATLEDDGTYTINLEAYATGETVTTTTNKAVPLDIVMVIDQSGSMANSMSGYSGKTKVEYLKTAVENFAAGIASEAANDVDHRIAVAGFASGSSYSYENTELYYPSAESTKGYTTKNYTNLNGNDYEKAFFDACDTNGDLNSAIGNAIKNFKSKGATALDLGMKMAQNIFNYNPIPAGETRKRVVVVFTDGVPTTSDSFSKTIANNALSTAQIIKTTQSATIYTVSLFERNMNDLSKAKKVLHGLSSYYPNATDYSVVSTPTPEDTDTVVDVSDVDNNKIYYIYENSKSRDLTAVTYDSTNSGWYTANSSHKKYVPAESDKWNENDRRFYKRTYTNKYYMPAENPSELNNIFESIKTDIIESDTKVALTANAVMRDILGTGFILPYTDTTKANNIVVKTCTVTMDSSGKVTEGIETDTSKGLKNRVVVDVDAEKDYYALDVTGFDYKNKYVSVGHPGEKLKVTIKGVVATDDAITNDLVDTNNKFSGIYESAYATAAVKNFPQPKTILTSKSYVLDYGKKVDFEAGDWKQDKTTHLALDMNGFSQSVNKLTQSTSSTVKYGEAEIATTAQTLTYKPQKINWDGYDSFYAFGKVDKNDDKIAEINKLSTGLNANRTGNIWSKINVIPATSVYYEDDFMTSSNSTDSGVRIQYSDDWKVVTDTEVNNDGSINESAEANSPTTTPDSDDKQESKNEIYGTDSSYKETNKLSGGSAHYVEGKYHKTNAPEASLATFTFTGTGVDIYSCTNIKSGVVVANLYKGTKVLGKGQDCKASVADHYWSEKEGLYQVPTLFFKDLAYGTYTVQLKVYAADSQYTNRNIYYLDGIRVYEPLKDKEATDTTIQDAYSEGNEYNSKIFTLRELLIPTKDEDGKEIDFSAKLKGAVYSDKLKGETTTIAQYKDYGPANEVYLKKGQSIAFNISTHWTSGSKVYIGLKAPKGIPADATISGDEEVIAAVTDGNQKSNISVKSTSDMYYEITPNENGTVVISNAGEGLLAITKLRITGVPASQTALVYNPTVLTDMRKFSTLTTKTYENVQNTGNVTDKTESDTSKKETMNETLEVTIQQATREKGVSDVVEDEVWLDIKNNAPKWLDRL